MVSDRDEIRKACEAATPGPWEYDACEVRATGPTMPPDVSQWIVTGYGPEIYGEGHEPGVQNGDDGHFIAGAREWVPALLAENDELRDALRWTGSPTPHPEFLRWIADRLVNVHGENPNVDYVLSLRQRADAFERALLGEV
jgi:hypothetical protein